MPAPSFTASDFARALANLLPTGEVWPKEPGSLMMRALSALAGTPARNHAAANALLVDAFPGTAVSLLPEWEATLGLPNDCTPLGTTVEDRQVLVRAKLADTGGASKAYFLNIMATYGYTDATIETFAPFRVGIDTVDWPLYSNDWAFVWWMHASSYSPIIDASVTCEIQEVAPAHTIFHAIFVGGDGWGYDWGNDWGGGL